MGRNYAACVVLSCLLLLILEAPLRPPLLLVDIKESNIYILFVCLFAVLGFAGGPAGGVMAYSQ